MTKNYHKENESRKRQSLLDSFNYALQGVIQALKNERNLKIHFLIAFIVLILCLFYDFEAIEILLILSTITVVIVAELFNTAIEAVVDLVCGNKRHPLAKLAKDIGAGAVFITAINAFIVGYVLFYKKLETTTMNQIYIARNMPFYAPLIGLLLVFLITIVIKTITGHTNPLRGGMPSGHSSISFAAATCILFLTNNLLAISLAYFLAFMVAQSRLEGKIHSLVEIITGALTGILITLTIFRIFYG